MSVDTLSTPFETSAPPRRRPGELGRHLLTPLVLGAAVAGLYLYVSSQELDSLEARVLEGELIRGAALQLLNLTGIATVLVALIAIPLGILLTRPAARWLTPWVMGLANIGQAA